MQRTLNTVMPGENPHQQPHIDKDLELDASPDKNLTHRNHSSDPFIVAEMTWVTSQ